MAISIELNFFYYIQKVDRFQLSFQSEKQAIKENKSKINIPASTFKYGKDKTQMSIRLFKTNSNENNEYTFYVYYGENKAYIQLDELTFKSYEIILKSIENLHISGIKSEFTELDTIENTNKKRLVLINYDSNYLKINNIIYDLSDIIQTNCDIKSSSYQLSEIDLQTKKFIVKPFEPKDECEIKFLFQYKEQYKNFAEDLDNLFYCKDNEYTSNIKEIKNNYENLSKYSFINFHKTNEYLSKLFELNGVLDIDLFFNFFKCIYFFEYINDFINKRTITQCFIEKIEEIFEKIKEHDTIPIYEKIRALNALFYTNDNIKNLDELNSLNIKYYVTSEKIENSILDKVVKFFDYYISGLNENSAVYENLLFLDGGHGFFNKEMVYTYDLTNLKMIKLHLKDIFPKILIFCNIKNDEIAFTTPEFGSVVINEYHLLKNYQDIKGIKDIDYNYPYKIGFNEEILNDISMNIILDLIHEIMGHKKYALVENGYLSPKKIINKKKQLIELKHIEELNPNDMNGNEYILTSKKEKGDSGHFLELSYGKVDNILITKLLFEMKNKGKLLKRYDLFIDSGETLKKYVYLRNAVKKKNIKYNFNDSLSIEDEIKEMDSLIDDKSKIGEEDKKQNEIFEKFIPEKEEKNELLKKKRNHKKQESYKKRNNLDLQKLNEIENNQEDLDDENDSENNKQLSLFERIKNKTREEIIEMSKKRIMEKYKFKFDESIRYNMIKKMKELDVNDPYYYDLLFAISEYKKTV